MRVAAIWGVTVCSPLVIGACGNGGTPPNPAEALDASVDPRTVDASVTSYSHGTTAHGTNSATSSFNSNVATNQTEDGPHTTSSVLDDSSNVGNTTNEEALTDPPTDSNDAGVSTEEPMSEDGGGVNPTEAGTSTGVTASTVTAGSSNDDSSRDATGSADTADATAEPTSSVLTSTSSSTHTSSTNASSTNASSSTTTGTTSTTPPVQGEPLPDAVTLDAGDFHTCAVLDDGSVYCWGNNNYGQLGDGTTTGRVVPVAVTSLTDVASVSAGGFVTCALTTDGTLSCFGINEQGELGNGTTVNSSVPVEVSNFDDVAEVSVGAKHTCAYRAGETVHCWGRENTTELGISGNPDTSVPNAVTVRPLPVVSIAVGQLQTVVALPDGQADTWGNFTMGLDYFPRDGNVARVTAGYLHSCALLTDQTVVCWGNGSSGQLGHGEFAITSQNPVFAQGLDQIGAVSAGHQHTCALRLDNPALGTPSGSVWCWGSNSYGQLGDGTAITRSSPVKVYGIEDAVAISTGYAHSCAVLKAGDMRCWGWNEWGQLGDGTTTSSTTPVVVQGVGALDASSMDTSGSTADTTTSDTSNDTEPPVQIPTVTPQSPVCDECVGVLATCALDRDCAECVDADGGGCDSVAAYSDVVECLCDGTTRCDTVDVCVAAPRAPHLLAPISTSYQGPLPTFRWEIPSDADDVRMVLCRDRSCGVPIASATGVNEVTLEQELDPGVYFWFAVSRRQRADESWVESTEPSPTWEFVVDHSGIPKPLGFGHLPDSDGNGRPELMIGNSSDSTITFRDSSMTLMEVTNTGVLGQAQLLRSDYVSQSGASGASWATTWTFVGDVNGDGYGDAVTDASNRISDATLRTYLGGPDGFTPGGDLVVVPDSDLGFGISSIAALGDVDADGYADVAVQVAKDRALYVFRGSPTGLLAPLAPLLFAGTTVPQLRSLGDVNGDGYPDLLVVFAGNLVEVQVFLGGASGLATTPAFTFPGVWGGDPVGDVNADGYTDFIVWTTHTVGTRVFPDTTYLVLGGEQLELDETSTLGLPQYFPEVGTCQTCTVGVQGTFTPAGDLNGDGFADAVLAGEVQEDPLHRVYVYYGGSDGLSNLRLREMYNPDDLFRVYYTYYGWSVGGPGDLDGDTLDDFAIGAADVGSPGAEGRLHPRIRVYRGTTSGLSLDDRWFLQSSLNINYNDGFGVNLVGLGG